MSMIPPETPGDINTLTLGVSVVVAWLTGESGKVFIASGAGGLARWMSVKSERRRIRDGVVAVISGAIAGSYMWPAVLGMMSLISGRVLEPSADNVAMAAFVAGTMGMSAVKIIIALIEARAKALSETRNEQ